MNEQEQKSMEMKPQKKKIYKKWWFGVIIGVLGVFLLAGLMGEESDSYTEQSKTAQTESTQTEETEKVLSESEYKSKCKTYTYKELARNPDNYKGVTVSLKGEVIQVLESGKNIELRLNIDGNYEETVYVTYTLKEDEGRILEYDIVTIYGSFEGLYSYESVMGAEITLPQIAARYIDLVE